VWLLGHLKLRSSLDDGISTKSVKAFAECCFSVDESMEQDKMGLIDKIINGDW